MSPATTAGRGRGPGPRQPLLVAAAVVLLVSGGWAVGRLTTPATAYPAEGSPEAGFARDMQVHHQQAVEMSMLVRDRTDDPGIRRLAYDVVRTQQHQAGQMYGWLSVWGLPQASREPAMSWMDGHADHSPAPGGATMPGLATAAELDALENAEGLRAERLYLDLMVPHHEAGVAMAEAVLDSTEDPAVRSLAQSILASQQAEIRYLEQLSQTR